jgi:hypothetical protein
MLQFGFGEAFVVVDCAVANQLYLRNPGDSLEIRMENGFLGALCLVITMAVAL